MEKSFNKHSKDSDKLLKLSVVIGCSYNVSMVIAQCLRALRAQKDIHETEIIVTSCATDETAHIIRKQFPDVHLLHFDERLSLPQLQGRGIAVARGKIIAILAPFSIVDEHWMYELLKAHDKRSNLAIGGTVDLFNADAQDLLRWAIYLNEYAMFMRPLPAGEMEILPGSNISYKREALFNGEKQKQDVFWKTFVNWGIVAAGSPLWQAPSVVVHLHKQLHFWEYLCGRFYHGRCFAGMRVADSSVWERLLRAITSPLLPFLLLWRWGRRFWVKRHYRAKFVLTLPLHFIFFGFWACGEFVGYLSGPGHSCSLLSY